MSIELFDNMIGRTMVSVDGSEGDDSMVFADTTGSRFVFHYESECCANCCINDIVGDISDLIGSPIVLAELVSCDSGNDKPSEGADSWTWSFYRYATVKGTVTVRWLGESNGYYSETVTYSEHIK